jgi:Leucine-rich repeat (LRR) protein
MSFFRKLVRTTAIAGLVTGSFVVVSPIAASATTTVTISDSIFEQKLIDLGYDTGTVNGTVLLANIDNVRTLDLSGLQISNFTGLSSFSELRTLSIANNTTATSFSLSNGHSDDDT